MKTYFKPGIYLLLCIAFIISGSTAFTQELITDTETISDTAESGDSKNDKKKKETHGRETLLDKIIVTPTKGELTYGDSPASISVVDDSDMELSSARQLDETMKSVTGVFLKRSKFADTTTSVNIRGFSGDRRNLVLYDGMPMLEGYSSSVDWSAMSSGAVEKIEIVKGPFSSLYGRNAMGGVVSIITKTPEKFESGISTGYGTYDTYSGSAWYGDRYYGFMSVLLQYEFSSTDGHRSTPVLTTFATGTGATDVTGWQYGTGKDGSPFSGTSRYFVIGDKGRNSLDRKNASGKFCFDITDNSKLTYSFTMQEYLYGYHDPRSYLVDSSGNTVYTGDVTITAGADTYHKTLTENLFIYYTGSGESITNLHILDYSLKTDAFNIKAKLGLNESESWYTLTASGSDFSGGPGTLSRTDPKRSIYLDVQSDINLTDTFMLTVGAGGKYDHAENDKWNLYDWRDEDSIIDTAAGHVSEAEGSQFFSSLYTQAEYSLLDKLVTIYAGARLDSWVNFDGKSRYKTTDREYGSTTDWYVSPKVSMVVRPMPESDIACLESIRVSYGHAYSPPDIYQLYTYWESGSVSYNPNPDLKPEKSRSWEAGADMSFFNKTLIVTGTVFRSVITDMFYNRVIDSTTKMQGNAGEGEIRGAEAEARLYLLDIFEIYGNITKTHTEITRNSTDPGSVGKQFTLVPELMYNAGIKGFYSIFEGSINWRYSDKVYNTSNNTDTAEGTYGVYDKIILLDMKLIVKPEKHLSVSMSVNNMLGREYYQSYKCEGRTFFWEAKLQL